ncbi:LPS translocon maturation chaperone LptM [Candidatus Methylocalor cossyra]|uniref:Lipoprotein n=1 Tax=Candidatus Methylocalor cossyra TaxID=3108543 RepID=A0ABP1C4M7_9GAMM
MTAWRCSLAILLSALLATGCGQKGPLYLPGHEPSWARKHPPDKEPSTPKDQAPPTTPQPALQH